ncbi:uncharacterized protein BKA55DRAFT_548158, partial [Fusarium redolens]
MGTFGMRRVTLTVTAQGAERGESQGHHIQNDIHLNRERSTNLTPTAWPQASAISLVISSEPNGI